MPLLALDVGRRRTGAAVHDASHGITLPLDTIQHASFDELIAAVEAILTAREIDEIILGLPLLPSGDEGAQAVYVRKVGAALEQLCPVRYIDERYTTPLPSGVDGDATAACELLRMAVEIMKNAE